MISFRTKKVEFSLNLAAILYAIAVLVLALS